MSAVNLTRDELAGWATKARAQGKVVCLTNGAFDLFHVGHLRYLQGAKEHVLRQPGGGVVLAAVNSDRSVRAAKGEGRPVIPADERAEIVGALGCVDAVHIFDEDQVLSVIEAVKPDFHAKGTDYTPETVPEAELVRSLGGEVIITGDPKDHSTSALVER